jgi:hypothetical protein
MADRACVLLPSFSLPYCSWSCSILFPSHFIAFLMPLLSTTEYRWCPRFFPVELVGPVWNDTHDGRPHSNLKDKDHQSMLLFITYLFHVFTYYVGFCTFSLLAFILNIYIIKLVIWRKLFIKTDAEGPTIIVGGSGTRITFCSKQESWRNIFVQILQ